MPETSCKNQVQSFIGMINYLSKFSARLSQLAIPIGELSKDKVAFNWGPEHWKAFNSIKKKIMGAPILAYYNPKNKWFYRQMRASKGWVHAYYKKENLYTLQIRPSQMLKKGTQQ